MKTILIKVIDPTDQMVRENEVLVSRIVGWYSRGRRFHFRHSLPGKSIKVDGTTIVSIDSGVEYEIAESLESFRDRLSAIVDVPYPGIRGFTGFKPFSEMRSPLPPFLPTGDFRCLKCGKPTWNRGMSLTVAPANAAPSTFEIAAHPLFGSKERLCGQCICCLAAEQVGTESK